MAQEAWATWGISSNFSWASEMTGPDSKIPPTGLGSAPPIRVPRWNKESAGGTRKGQAGSLLQQARSRELPVSLPSQRILLPPGGSWWPTVVMRPENWLALGMPCRALSPVAPLTHATQGWQARWRPCWVCKALDTAAGTGGHFASRVPPVRAGPGTLRHATVLLALRWFLVRRLPSHRPGMYAGIKLFPSPSFSGIAGTDRRNRNA